MGSLRDELHELIDQIPEERLAEVLKLVREYLAGEAGI